MNLTIEQMREIVDGAPSWPVIGYCTTGNNYIFTQCEQAPCSYSNLDNAWSEEYAINYIPLDDLRTAIANHEKCQHEWNETTSNGDAYRFFVCKHCDSTQNYVPFKDDNPSHFDHCTDIRNHISPLTGVIEG